MGKGGLQYLGGGIEHVAVEDLARVVVARRQRPLVVDAVVHWRLTDRKEAV